MFAPAGTVEISDTEIRDLQESTTVREIRDRIQNTTATAATTSRPSLQNTPCAEVINKPPLSHLQLFVSLLVPGHVYPLTPHFERQYSSHVLEQNTKVATNRKNFSSDASGRHLFASYKRCFRLIKRTVDKESTAMTRLSCLRRATTVSSNRSSVIKNIT